MGSALYLAPYLWVKELENLILERTAELESMHSRIALQREDFDVQLERSMSTAAITQQALTTSQTDLRVSTVPENDVFLRAVCEV